MFKIFAIILAVILMNASSHVYALEPHLKNQAPNHTQFLELQEFGLLGYILEIEGQFINAIQDDYQKKLGKVKSIHIVEEQESMWIHLSSRFSLNDGDKQEYNRLYDHMCSDKRFYIGAIYAYDHIVLCFTNKLNFEETSVWKNKSVVHELREELKEILIHEYTHHLQFTLLNNPSISDKGERIDWWGYEWLVEGTAMYFASKYVIRFGGYPPDLLRSYYIDTFSDKYFTGIDETSFESVEKLDLERSDVFYEFSKYATFSLLQIAKNRDKDFIGYFECVGAKESGCFTKLFHTNSEMFYERWTDFFDNKPKGKLD